MQRRCRENITNLSEQGGERPEDNKPQNACVRRRACHPGSDLLFAPGCLPFYSALLSARVQAALCRSVTLLTCKACGLT